MTSTFKRYDQMDADFFRRIILGEDVETNEDPVQADTTRPMGLMTPETGVREPSLERALGPRDPSQRMDPNLRSTSDNILTRAASALGAFSTDRQQVADAIVPRQEDPPQIDLSEWESLPPLEDVLDLRRSAAIDAQLQAMNRDAVGIRESLRPATPAATQEPDAVNVEESTQGAGIEMVPAGEQVTEETPTEDISIPEDLYSPVGPAYRRSQIVRHSYYNAPIEDTGLRGRSRKAGDAPQEVQRAAIESIIRQGKAAGMSNEDIALTLAIARHESGFNPDAAAGTTSAHGLGQFVNATGEAYGLNDENRWDLDTQARALIEHTQDNIRLAERNGQGREYVYAYHHDGPSLAYGGLDIGRQNVMPRVDSYLEIVKQYEEE